MAESIHVGDVGTVIRVRLVDGDGAAVDVSDATSITFIFAKPSGGSLQGTGVFLTNGTDGRVSYTTQAGDMDEDGRWQVQVHVVSPGGSWHSDIGKFKVKPNL